MQKNHAKNEVEILRYSMFSGFHFFGRKCHLSRAYRHLRAFDLLFVCRQKVKGPPFARIWNAIESGPKKCTFEETLLLGVLGGPESGGISPASEVAVLSEGSPKPVWGSFEKSPASYAQLLVRGVTCISCFGSRTGLDTGLKISAMYSTSRSRFIRILWQNVAKRGPKKSKKKPKVQKEAKKRSKSGPVYYRFFSTGRIKFHFSLLVK